MSTIRERHEMVKGQEYYPSDGWWAVVQTEKDDIGTLLELLDDAMSELLTDDMTTRQEKLRQRYLEFVG